MAGEHNIAASEVLEQVLVAHRACAYTSFARGNHESAAAAAPFSAARASRTNDYWSYTPDDWAEFDALINRLCDVLKLSAAERAAALAARRQMPVAERPVALANLRQKLRRVSNHAA